MLFITIFFIFIPLFQTTGDIIPLRSFLPETRKQESSLTHQAMGITEAETSFTDDGIYSADESYTERDIINITTNRQTDIPRKRKNTVIKEL